jgi:hypothetical protein
LTDNCGVGGAKSGNIDGVAEAKLVQMVVLNIEITLLMQQMIVEMQLIKKTVRITDNTTQFKTDYYPS